MTLFNNFRARDIKQAKLDEVVKTIRALKDDELLALSDDDFVEDQVREHHVEVPVLDFDADNIMSNSTGNFDITDAWGEARTVRGVEVKFSVPFKGTKDVFHWQADTISLSPPSGSLFNNTVWFSVAKTSFEGPEEIARIFQQWRASLEEQLKWHRESWATFDDDIRKAARETISALRKKVLDLRAASAEAASMLGLRVRIRDDDPEAFVAPPLRQKIEVKLPSTGSKKPAAADPSITGAIYDAIIRILVGAGKTLERSGAALRDQDEETLRDILMLPLNSHFEGLAHGEAFNKAGKTDIIVRFEQTNLFVAECKIWDGAKVLAEAIDQLFTYLTWRDSRAAIIIFSKNKNITNVVESAIEAAKQHSAFVALDKTLDEGVWQLTFKYPSDGQRRVVVTLMVFDMRTGPVGQ